MFIICICGVKSTVIQLNEQKSYPYNSKENNRRFTPEITTFLSIS